MTDRQKETFHQVLAKYGATEFHHADCLGADAEAVPLSQSGKRPTLGGATGEEIRFLPQATKFITQFFK
jgi:hypothetical protein